MDGYEKLVKIIQAKNQSETNIFLTTMETSDSCYVNDLLLESDDLLVADHLTDLTKGDFVIVMKINDETYVILERVV